MPQSNKESIILSALLLLSVVLIYFLFLADHINFVTADLGRHLKNGEIFFKELSVIKTNFYSYTEPLFPVVTHHLGAGIVFYAIWKVFSFVGLHIFFILLSVSSLLISLLISKRYAPPSIISLSAIISMTVLAQRTEIRPEAFSYLLAVLFFYLFSKYRHGEIGFKKLSFIIVPLSILWVNLHIYFFLGFAIAGAFALEALLKRGFGPRLFKPLSFLLSVQVLFSLLNPFGFRGLSEPFFILGNFGYRLVENQSLWFLFRALPQANLYIFSALLFLLLVFLSAVFFKKSWRDIDLALVFVASGFSIMALLQLRNYTIFALFFIPAFSYALLILFENFLREKALYAKRAVFSLALFFILTLLSGEFSKVYPYNPSNGLGLLPDVGESAEFFKREGLEGPIFNNYDNGGFLIFYLYPKEKVFVDNRPEAYPASFFEEVYIPMQESDEIWRREMKRYGFNAIFFHLRDLTPWGQSFLRDRIDDREWAPVYADPLSIIFLKRNEKNAEVIKKFEIPRNNFLFN